MTLSLPLTSSDEVRTHLADPEVRVVDCRFVLDDPSQGRRDYEAGHIPGALYLSLDHDLSGADGPGRHPLPPPSMFAERLARLGIGNDHTVIGYDASGGAFATRLWWMLRSLGHRRAGVLDGGWPAWLDVGGAVSTQAPTYPPASLELTDEWTGVMDGAAVEARLGDLTLIDARAPERFRGQVEPLDPVAGHIPTARNLPYDENLTAEGGFRPAAELRERFHGLGGDIVVYCGSGVTACHNLLAMELAGIGGADLYPGSWSDWCASGREIATGD